MQGWKYVLIELYARTGIKADSLALVKFAGGLYFIQ